MMVVPLGERAGDGENRQFIDQARHFLPLNHGCLEVRAGDLDDPARFHLVDVLDCFANLRAHPHEHAEKSGAGFV